MTESRFDSQGQAKSDSPLLFWTKQGFEGALRWPNSFYFAPP
jgi:hypothetical protein